MFHFGCLYNKQRNLLETILMKPLFIMQYNTFLRRELPYLADLYDGQVSRMIGISESLLKRKDEIDLLVLNELFHSDRKKMLDRLGSVWKHTTSEMSCMFTPESSGVYIMSKSPIVRESDMIFSSAKNWDRLASKGVKYVQLHHEKTHVHVFATHLQATYGLDDRKYRKVREHQVQELVDFIKKQDIPHDELVIVAGDFNIPYEKKSGSEYKHLTRKLVTHKFSNDLDKQYSLSKSNQLYGLVDVARVRGCWEHYIKNHVCCCCEETLVDYVFVLSEYRKPSSTFLTAITDFKPEKPIHGYFHKTLKRKTKKNDTTNNCNDTNEDIITIEDFSDHYPVLATITL